jgi:UDP-2,4-diacetamido-2,4,6-trideoxy-beta-L-altropyranose hydrolase
VRVAVRVDAGPLIGGGHAMRCLTLADALAARGAKATFVTAAMPDVLAERIAAEHKLVRIPASAELGREGEDWHQMPLSEEAQTADVRATVAAAGKSNWLIVDHYLLDARWHSAARRFAERILVIDDLANREYDCDLLLDQTHGRSAADYLPLVPANSTVLAGAIYALLRSEFARERSAALTRRRDVGPVRRILVSLGTTDPEGITAKAVGEVLAAAPGRAIDVVLGPDAASVTRIREVVAENAGVTVHVGTARMAQLMRDADIAIGAAGATSWERCCLGLPAIVVVLADNQRIIGNALAEAGAHILVDRSGGVADALSQLLSDADRRHRMSAAAFAIVDGFGTSRVVRAMTGEKTARSALPITMRHATDGDCETLWLWRNDSVTRRASRTKEAIPWTDHESWFSSVMSNPDRHLLIAEADGSPVAMVRFDRLETEPNAYEISINIRPDSRGSGVGRAVLSTACAEFAAARGATRITAGVDEGNEASRRLFESCGFSQTAPADAHGFVAYVLDTGALLLGGRKCG